MTNKEIYKEYSDNPIEWMRNNECETSKDIILKMMELTQEQEQYKDLPIIFKYNPLKNEYRKDMKNYTNKEFKDYEIKLDDGITYFCNFNATLKVCSFAGSIEHAPEHKEEITDIWDLEISYYTEENVLKRSINSYINSDINKILHGCLTGLDFE